jgi:protein-L-isoaspartate(D-aspartate) O-methyltransferase
MREDRVPAEEGGSAPAGAAAVPGQGPAGNDLTAHPDPQSPARKRMVSQDLRTRGISHPRVLEVMERVPRHEFVPDAVRRMAYDDYPLPIGQEQTISQPYIVALMTQAVRPRATDRVLEVGTGSGYQAAVLAELCKEVDSIEILPALADGARCRLTRLGYKNITVHCADGYRGWPKKAPFDIIVVTAAPQEVPEPLVRQLAVGGRMVLPVGDFSQELVLIEKQKDGTVRRESLAAVRFVPMTGEVQTPKTLLPVSH